MKLNELKSAPGTRKAPYRKGRGIGTGNGKTAGRGHKGQNSRAGGGVRPGFEGGQMPLYRRLPKRGFTNIFAKHYVEVNVEELNRFEANTEITAELLKEAVVISRIRDGVVIVGRGEVTSKGLTVKARRFSKTAEEKITGAGGKVEVV